VIGATGVLTALVPGSMILMTTATLIANNLYRAVNPSADDRQVSLLAKLLVPLVALVGVFFTLKGGETIVALLLMGYSFVTQLFPSLVLSLARRNIATREGAAAGIIAGVGTVAALSLSGTKNFQALSWLPPQVQDLNIGIVALAVNFIVLIVVSLAMRRAAAPAGAAAE
jgi:SSS family solute:Na+ symporter